MNLNKQEYLSLCSIVDYLHDDELKNYEELVETSEASKYHIWHDVKTLSLKLKEYKMKETV